MRIMRPFDRRSMIRRGHFRTFAVSQRTSRRRFAPPPGSGGNRGPVGLGSLAAVAGTLLLTIPGCSITGNWERVETDPPGAPFPVEEVTFTDTNEYAARWQQYGRAQFSVGTYKLFGTRLDVQQYGSKPLTYSARVRSDGLLELVYSHEGQPVKALLKRKDEPRDRGDAVIDAPNAPEITEAPESDLRRPDS